MLLCFWRLAHRFAAEDANRLHAVCYAEFAVEIACVDFDGVR